MCVMEVRPGQRPSTIMQAMFHNTNTVIGDADMFRALLIGHGDVENLAHVERAQVFLQRAAAELRKGFASEIAHDIDSGMDPDHSPIGAEHVHARAADLPTLADIAKDAAEIASHRAAKYETR